MGIIFDNKVSEKELYSAYGLTVYGKENDYDWTIYPDEPMEKCYTSLRINDGTNDVINLTLGNRCIFKKNFDQTIDNFLYWIKNDAPSDYIIENAVFKSLTCTDSIFNHRIEMRKYKERQDREFQKRIEEREKNERAAVVEIIDYCTKHKYFWYEKYKEMVILKPLNKKAMETIKNVIDQNNTKMLEGYINFATEYPENNDLRIVRSGSIDEVLDFVRN